MRKGTLQCRNACLRLLAGAAKTEFRKLFFLGLNHLFQIRNSVFALTILWVTQLINSLYEFLDLVGERLLRPLWIHIHLNVLTHRPIWTSALMLLVNSHVAFCNACMARSICVQFKLCCMSETCCQARLSSDRHAKVVRVPGKSAKNLADLRLCDLFDNLPRALLSAEDRKTVVIW